MEYEYKISIHVGGRLFKVYEKYEGVFSYGLVFIGNDKIELSCEKFREYCQSKNQPFPKLVNPNKFANLL